MQYFAFHQLGDAPDGSQRMLGFDMNVIADIEDAMGGQSIYRLMQQPGFNFIRHLAWAGLKWQDPKLTPADAGDLIQKFVIDKGKSLETLVDPIMEAIKKSGVLGKEKKAGPQEPKVGTGRPTETAPAEAAEPETQDVATEDVATEAEAAEPSEGSAPT